MINAAAEHEGVDGLIRTILDGKEVSERMLNEC